MTSITRQIELAASHGRHIAGTPYTYYHGWVLRNGTPGHQVSHPDLGTGVIRHRHNIGGKKTADVFFPLKGIRANFEVSGTGATTYDPVDYKADLHKRVEAPQLSPAPNLPSFESTGGYFGENPMDRNLDEAELNAVHDYLTPEGSAAINDSLRAGRPIPAERRADAHILDRLIAGSTLTAPAVVYRGMSLTPELEKELRPGKIFSDKAYGSTSDSLEWAQMFADMRSGKDENKDMLPGETFKGRPVVMRISAPAGAHMLSGETDIGEYVMPRGTRYRVDSVNGSTYNLTVVPK